MALLFSIKAAAPTQREWVPSTRFSTRTNTRTEVRPPALFAASQPVWQRWVATAWQWLWDTDDQENHPRVLQGLQQVKQEFTQVLWDLQSYQACAAREQIEQARSLRDLWHQRADLFQVIAIHRGEAEAQARLDQLNRHFPVRISVSEQHLH